MTQETLTTGVVGLGAMGAGLAANLQRAGYLARAWNRTRARAEALAGEIGIILADDLADLARHCELIVTSVSADADLLQVLDQIAPALRAGSVLVDTSTVSSDSARRAADRLEKVGAHFLDAPVSGGVEGARAGTLAMMVGGEPEILERVRPALEVTAKRIVHMGPVGAGQATKAVNQIMAAGINQAVTEALAFGAAMGLPMERVIEVVGGGAAGNWFLDHRGPSMLQGRFEPGFKLALHHKDLAICKQMAADLGVQLPVVEMTLIHYRRLMQAGLGERDISALFTAKQALFDHGS